MIRLSSLILERFELPADLQKQLENTAYSALGHILTPYMEKFKKELFSTKEFNDKSYTGLVNVFSTVRKLTEGDSKNTKVNITDILITEFYSTDLRISKEKFKKISVKIEKSKDVIYIESNEKKEKLFPDFVIHKDYAGWDMGNFNKFSKSIETDYKNFEKNFDYMIVIVENIMKKLNEWKVLDKAKKPKIHPDNLKMSLVYEKTTPMGVRYDHYFRVNTSKEFDKTEYANYFSESFRPYIVQTIYLDHYRPMESVDLKYWMSSVNGFINITLHEGRHLLQYYGDTLNKINQKYGRPKKRLTYRINPDVRGTDPHGTAQPKSSNTDPIDTGGRVLHPFRDIEYKTNLYDYKENIVNFLNNNLTKDKWKEGFKDIIRYVADDRGYYPFTKKYPFSSSFINSITAVHLKQIFKKDRPKFNQLVRELYKLIFNS